MYCSLELSIWSHIRTNDHQCNHIVIDICCKGATFIGRSYFGVPSAIFNGMGPKSRNGHQRNPTRFPSPGSPFLLQLLQLLIWNLILHDVACDGVITAARIQSINKKRSPYSITQRRVPELIPVLGSQPAGDVSHKPSDRLPLLSARPAVTPATLKRAATILLLGEQSSAYSKEFFGVHNFSGSSPSPYSSRSLSSRAP